MAIETKASFLQELIWRIRQVDPESPWSNMFFAWRLHGTLDPSALRNALDRIVARHEALRTLFRDEGKELLQIILPLETSNEKFFEFKKIDLRCLPLTQRENAAARLALGEAHRVLDPVKGPLMRTQVLILEDGKNVLFMNLHHIISDMRSVALILDELWSCYTAEISGRIPALTKDVVQFREFVEFQRRAAVASEFADQRAYWQEILAGSFATDLPLKASYPANGYVFDLYRMEFGKEIIEYARHSNVAVLSVLVTAVAMVVSSYGDKRRMLVRSHYSNRRRFKAASLLGVVADSIVLDVRILREDSLGDLLCRVRGEISNALGNGDVPPLVTQWYYSMHEPRGTTNTPEVSVNYFENPILNLDVRGIPGLRGMTDFPWQQFVGEPKLHVPGLIRYGVGFAFSRNIDGLSGIIQTPSTRAFSSLGSDLYIRLTKALSITKTNPSTRVADIISLIGQ